MKKGRNKMRRIFAIFMVFCMIFTFSGVTAFAANDSIHLKDGDGFVFKFHILPYGSTEEKTLTIPRNGSGSYDVTKTYDDGSPIEDRA